MLWNFFQQALASPRVNVDSAFRAMLRCSRSSTDYHPFVEEPSSFFADDPTLGASTIKMVGSSE